MRNSLKFLLVGALLAPIAYSLTGCGCGFDCNNGNNNDEPSSLTLGFSDSLPEDLKEVVIEVDSITLQRSGADDIVIDTFTIDDLNLTDAETFQIDLLEYRGVRQLDVITDLEIDSGTYSGIALAIIDGDINSSYAKEADDSLKEIEVVGDLQLTGMSLASGTQAFTVEFGLAQSLRFQSASDNYRLDNVGIRVENTVTAAKLSGLVDSALFDAVSPCDEKTDPEEGNRLYLYDGTGLGTSNLADVFTSSSDNDVPDNAIAPFAVASLVENTFTGNWEYVFGYLPAGDYTMVFACDTAEDDSVDYDGLAIPLPEEQVYEITLSEQENVVCNVSDAASC
jgi:hypothetical protein